MYFVSEVLASTIKLENLVRGTRLSNEIKLFIFADIVIILEIEEISDKTQTTKDKVRGYKINTQKSTALYTQKVAN